MKEVIIIDKEEFDHIPIVIAKLMKENSEKGYGYKLNSNETHKNYDDVNMFLGWFAPIWDKAMKGDDK